MRRRRAEGRIIESRRDGWEREIQGGEDLKDHLSSYFIFRKSDLYLVALLWKMICNFGDPMSLRHRVVGEREQTHTRAHNPRCEGLCVYMC